MSLNLRKARLLCSALTVSLAAQAGAALAQTVDQPTPPAGPATPHVDNPDTAVPADGASTSPPAAQAAAPDGLLAQTGQATGASGTSQNEIVVVGNRYQASNLQMKAQNTVNVLSAQDLQHTAVHNVAEALGLLPGINVSNTGSAFAGGVDGASRGEGMFVSIRGLNSEYNINLINGVDVAQGNPYSRGVQLSLLPPSGLQTVVLNKTSSADMDGDAIGGTVDFHTPSAFDFSKDRTASLTVGGRLESRARRYGENGLGYNAAGDVALKFGQNNQFGFYASGFYDVRHYANSLFGGVQESGCCDRGTDFAVQNADGTSADGLDPAKNLILTGANYGVSTGSTKRWGGNASFDFRPDDDTSFYIRGTYARADTEQNSSLTQTVATKLDGTNGVSLGNGLYGPLLTNVSTRFWYETNPERATLGTAQAGMQKRVGNLTISPNIFYTWGENARPNHIEVAGRTLGETGTGLAYGQSTLFAYKNDYAYPTLTDPMRAALDNIPGMDAAGGAPEFTPQTSWQKKGGGKIDLRYDVHGPVLDFVKVGAKVQDSWRKITNRDYTVPNYGDATTFGDLGIIKGSFDEVYPGKYTWSVPKIDQSALFDLYNQLGGVIDTCGSNSVNSYNCNTQKAKELVASGYAEASFVFNNLEVIPGIRFEHSEIRNTFWLTPTDADGNALTGSFSHNKTHYDEWLPSLFFNLRPGGNAVYRAGVWTSYVRPPFLQLGGGANTTVSGNVTTITEGNPDLKPIKSLNLDASGEWNIGSGGHLMLAGFYKHLRDYIYDNGSSAGIVTAENAGVTSGTITYQPRNGGSGNVYGIELSARQRFTMLTPPFDGLGLAGNVTRQWTKVDVLGDGTREDRIQNAPNWMANAQLFFEKGRVMLDVNYDYSGSYVSIYDTLGYNAKWDNVWIRPHGRLDLHAGYAINDNIKIDLSMSNILNEESYWSHIGRHTLAVSDIVNSGTTSLLTATIRF